VRQIIRCALAAVLLSAVSSNPGAAQNSSPDTASEGDHSALQIRAEQVIALVNGEVEPEEVLSDGFLAAIPAEQFREISRQLTTQFGAAISVETLDPPKGTRAALAIRMERTVARGGIAIDPNADNKVSELLFQNFESTDDSLTQIEADLDALSGEVAWWLGPLDGSFPPVISSGADTQMPIGSTFKLYVLATLAREVAEGKRSWSDPVTLSELRSFPSGMMQDWPRDAPTTLHTLASLMISISDNTATDVLIDELGRDAVFQTLIESGHSRPELNDPFLKTREMFLLKGGPEGRLRTYLGGSAELRRQILDGIEDIEVPAQQIEAAFSGAPVALDVEWFASARDITKLMTYMRERADPESFKIMAINPSIPRDLRGKWLYYGYKGGSEPGVLNLSWLLQDKNGQDHGLILSWRNDDVRFDPATLERIAQRLLSLEL